MTVEQSDVDISIFDDLDDGPPNSPRIFVISTFFSAILWIIVLLAIYFCLKPIS